MKLNIQLSLYAPNKVEQGQRYLSVWELAKKNKGLCRKQVFKPTPHVAPPGQTDGTKTNGKRLHFMSTPKGPSKKALPSALRFSLHFKQTIRKRERFRTVITVDTDQLPTRDWKALLRRTTSAGTLQVYLDRIGMRDMGHAPLHSERYIDTYTAARPV